MILPESHMSKFQLHPRFITDVDGHRTEAVLDIAEFEELCSKLEDQLDLDTLKAAIGKSKGGTPWREMRARIAL
jgi:hypothetical protein